MGEPKPLASLSSTLLARKGHAKPAMRPQGFASFGFGGGASHAQEDLGWNDMGHDPEPVSAEIVIYLNRLSDVLWLLARRAETPSANE